MFITGPPGSGKTTFLEDVMEMIKQEAPFQVESVLWLSSEKDRGIHTIRDKVNDFCKRIHSKPNTLRWIVIDDADDIDDSDAEDHIDDEEIYEADREAYDQYKKNYNSNSY
jgi:DNA polymerase III delta prime subunit